MSPLSRPIDLRYAMLPLDCCEFVVVVIVLVCVGLEFFSAVCFESHPLDDVPFT